MMKIKVIENPLQEEDLIITCRERTPELEKFLASLEDLEIKANNRGSVIYIRLDEILFFETEQDFVYVHLPKASYKTEYKLYELLEILPSNFMRVSKSSIVNLNKISGFERNLGSSRTIQFFESLKVNYASRMYFPLLKEKLNERSL